MYKKEISVFSLKEWWKIQKNGVGVCSVYTMRHCLQGPCQGPLYIAPKGNVILYDQQVKKIKITMILFFRVH